MCNTPADVHRERGTNAMLPSSALHCNWKRGIISIALAEEGGCTRPGDRTRTPTDGSYFLFNFDSYPPSPPPPLSPARNSVFTRINLVGALNISNYDTYRRL